jgi:nucleotide-binding universal stress UspA family protein
MSIRQTYETMTGPKGGPSTALKPTALLEHTSPEAAHIDLVTTRRGPIMVPLDGSERDAKALEWAAPIARQRAVPLLLVTVVEPWLAIEDLPLAPLTAPVGHAEPDIEADVRAAQETLNALGERLGQRFPDLQVQAQVLVGRSSTTLLDAETEQRPQLVVIATHGRTGIERFMHGSVAEKMLHDGSVPVLVIRPRDSEASMREDTAIRNVLVPLDGSPLAALAVPEALRLVTAPDGTVNGGVTLLAVVEPPLIARGSSPPLRRSSARDAMGRYLRRVAIQLEERGVSCTCVTLCAVDVPGAIVEDADIVVIGTHARDTLGRLLHGSVADRVAYASQVPVLPCRPHEDEANHAARPR